jgi:hypothetical protein
MTLLEQAREELKKYPGVVSVEVGIKETSGKLTEDLSFRVYVQKKKDRQDLSPDAVIPDRIFGVKTDIIEHDIPVATFDEKKYRPVKGGIQLANEEDSTGTLGCIARLNSDNSIVVLSNSHVLKGGGASGTIDVGQPKIAGSCCCTCDEIGEVVKDKHDGTVDCAIAKLKGGVSAENSIRTLNDDGTDGTITGDAAAIVSTTDKVKKVGRTSDKTEGTVVSITHSTSGNPSEGTPARTNQILIKPNSGFTLFQDRGDSGSVLVDKSNKIIGLMWGAYLTPGTSLHGHGIACPIGPVLTEMGITIINGSLTSLVYANAPVIEAVTEPATDGAYLVETLQYRLSQTRQGRLIIDLLESHRNEVLTLINHNRAVTVTWRRMQGPAFLAALGRSARVQSFRIPSEIEGVSRWQAISNVLSILREHGSQSLRGDIDQHSLTLIPIFSACDGTDEMINALEKTALRQMREERIEREEKEELIEVG